MLYFQRVYESVKFGKPGKVTEFTDVCWKIAKICQSQETQFFIFGHLGEVDIRPNFILPLLQFQCRQQYNIDSRLFCLIAKHRSRKV